MKKWIVSSFVFFSVFGFFSLSEAAEDVKKSREEQLTVRHMDHVSNLSFYSVREGETFSEIASSLFTTQEELSRLNPYVKPNVLSVGQRLNLDEKNIPKIEKQKTTLPSRSAKFSKPKRKLTNVQPKLKSDADAITFKASAYTSSAEENGGWAGLDYFGNPLKVGTVAVDPNVIPLGTKLYITGYTTPYLPQGGMMAVATDVGGSIKGNRIDIFLPTTRDNAWNFGYQNVQVRILK